MKIIWYFLFVIILIVLYIVAGVKNAPRLVHNITHKDKRQYWCPAEWLTDEHYDITERFYHD